MLMTTIAFAVALGASPTFAMPVREREPQAQERSSPVAAPAVPPTPAVAPVAPPSPPSPPAPPAPTGAGAPAIADVPAPQVPPAPPAPKAVKAPQAPKAPEAPPAPTPPPALAPVPQGQLVNVQVDVTVLEQVGTAAPIVRSISATAADGERSSVRNQASMKTSMGLQTTSLSLDVKPRVVGPNKIRAEIGLETNSTTTEGASKDVIAVPASRITQSVVLESGKSVVLSQATDPLSDRKTTIEVKATILR